MPFLNVTLHYGAETNNGIEHIYTLEKRFKLKHIPCMASRILLRDKMMKSVWFDRPTYDPETDTYFIVNECSKKLKRYDHIHHRRFFIAIHTAKQFEAAGWSIDRYKEYIGASNSMDPQGNSWDFEHFMMLEKNYKPERFIEEILGEVA